MGDITLALKTAQSGLLSNQQALNTVSNNVANVNTEGYSRKEINMKSVAVAGVGAGVRVADITRSIDEGLLKTLRLEHSEFSELTSQENYYARLQELFGTPGDNTSISHLVEKFAEAAELLAVSPDKTIEQSELVRRAADLTDKFKSMSKTIQELRLQTDQQIATEVAEINKITARIDTLNDEIIANSSVGRDVTDLRDQRDLEIDNLSKIVDTAYFYRSDGDVVIFTQAGRTLVDTVPPTLTHVSAATLTATSTHAEGDINPIYVGTTIAANDITTEIRGGKLKGLIDLRDSVMPDLQSQIDQLAADLRDSINQIHNRGTSFPGLQEATGTRIFVSATTQTIKVGSSTTDDDVAITLFDSSGNQSATTRLKTIMQDTTLGDGTNKGANGSWTVSEVASRIQGWLRNNGASSATVSVNTSGKLAVALNSTSLNLTFRDENSTTAGSTAEDVSIAFDADGNGTADETVSGFANFFGLNDLFVDNLAENLWESDVLASSYTANGSTGTPITIAVRDSSAALGTVSFTSSTSLADVATQITNNITNVTAAVVTDGSGVRLRISHDQGSSIAVTQTSGTFLTDAGIDRSDVTISGALSVRSDILSTPGKVSTGLSQWDSTKGTSGEYFASVGDNTIAQALAETMATAQSFKQAGGLAALSNTFAQYAGSILAYNADLANLNETRIDSQRSLVESLQFKSDSVRGVNLDEEMADLLIFEQAFAAAARVITVIQNMIEALERAVQ